VPTRRARRTRRIRVTATVNRYYAPAPSRLPAVPVLLAGRVHGTGSRGPVAARQTAGAVPVRVAPGRPVAAGSGAAGQADRGQPAAVSGRRGRLGDPAASPAGGGQRGRGDAADRNAKGGQRVLVARLARQVRGASAARGVHVRRVRAPDTRRATVGEAGEQAQGGDGQNAKGGAVVRESSGARFRQPDGRRRRHSVSGVVPRGVVDGDRAREQVGRRQRRTRCSERPVQCCRQRQGQ